MMYFKKLFLYLLLVVPVVACSKKGTIPEGIIPKETMAEILLDVHIMESKIEAVRYASRDSMQVAYFKEQKRILAENQVDSALYYKSYDYYFKQMFHMKDIYEIVAARAKELMEKHGGDKAKPLKIVPKIKPKRPKIKTVELQKNSKLLQERSKTLKLIKKKKK